MGNNLSFVLGTVAVIASLILASLYIWVLESAGGAGFVILIFSAPVAVFILMLFIAGMKELSYASQRKYVRCTKCGSEEFIENEVCEFMMPEDKNDNSFVTLSGFHHYVCSSCGRDAGYVAFTPEHPVPNKKYYSCASCGSTSFISSVKTKAKVPTSRTNIEYIGEEETIFAVCAQCGKPLGSEEKLIVEKIQN